MCALCMLFHAKLLHRRLLYANQVFGCSIAAAMLTNVDIIESDLLRPPIIHCRWSFLAPFSLCAESIVYIDFSVSHLLLT